MADIGIDKLIDASVGNDVPEDVDGGISIARWLVQTGETIPPWWSKSRDVYLSRVWKRNNHLSIAVYNTQAKIVGIPFRIRAVNESIPEHNEQAQVVSYLLSTASEFKKGFIAAYERFIEDLLTQDNGAFLEIIGDGSPDGPIIGSPLAVRHLDSSRCIRTGHPIYPVLYEDKDGVLYKLHWTRVIEMAQMPSARTDMNGVGFCAISRAIEIAQTLMDMIRYKQERLGSRPHNQLLVGQGITGRQIMEALFKTAQEADSRGLQRYGRTTAIGSERTDVSITKIDLNHLDPFDEQTGTTLGMYAIASAFGMDADELWPVGGRGTSKGDANLRRMRSRGRLPSQITGYIAMQFNLKFLPPHLRMEFDFKDDEEDQQRAIIRDIRGRNRERDLGTGSVNVRTARIAMLRDGDITRDIFDEMELADGRMPDGTSISLLFYDPDPFYVKHLRFLENPMLFEDNDAVEAIKQIQEARQGVLSEMATTGSNKKRAKARKALFALDWLEERYNFAAGRLLPQVPMQQRRMRTDIRVEPEEQTPPPGELSSAQATQPVDENIDVVGTD